MSDKINLKDLPAFRIFFILYEIVFRIPHEIKGWKSNPDKVEQEHLALLLAWPAILMTKLVSIIGDKEFEKRYEKIEKIINSNKKANKIRKQLESLFETISIPKQIHDEWIQALKSLDDDLIAKQFENIKIFIPKTIRMIELLILIKPVHIDHQTWKDLTFSLGNYFLIVLFLSKYLEGRRNEIYITINEIADLFNKNKINLHQINIYAFSDLWRGAMLGFLESTLDILSDQKPELSYLTSKPVPSTQLFLHQYCNDKGVDIGVITAHHDAPDESEDCDIYGIAIDANIFNELGYHLWLVMFSDDFPNQVDNINVLFFMDSFVDVNNITVYDMIVMLLFFFARKSSSAVKSIMGSWKKFIDDTAITVDQDFSKFEKWISSFIKEDEIAEVYFNFSPLAESIGHLDRKRNYPCMIKLLKKIETADINLISDEMRKILRKATVELYTFMALVRNYQDITLPDITLENDENDIDNKKVLNYFKKTRNKYKYLKHLKSDDIKNVDFLKEENAHRDAQRTLLPIIKSRLDKKLAMAGETIIKKIKQKKRKRKR